MHKTTVLLKWTMVVPQPSRISHKTTSPRISWQVLSRAGARWHLVQLSKQMKMLNSSQELEPKVATCLSNRAHRSSNRSWTHTKTSSSKCHRMPMLPQANPNRETLRSNTFRTCAFNSSRARSPTILATRCWCIRKHHHTWRISHLLLVLSMHNRPAWTVSRWSRANKQSTVPQFH